MALYAEYLFEAGAGDPVDSSGNGRDLVLDSGSYVAPGKDSDFALASGAGGTNGARGTFANPTAAATLMCWVMPLSLGSWQPCAVAANGGSTHLALFVRREDGFGPSGVIQGNIRVSTLQALNGGDNAPVDVWTHLALTYDGTDAILYVNAAPIANLNSVGTIGTGATFDVAGWSDNAGVADLQVDDVRLYDNALTQAEIEAIVGAGESVTLNGILPALEGDFAATSASTVQMAGSLPALEGSFDIAASADVDLGGVLPALTGAFDIASSATVDLAGVLPGLIADFQIDAEVTAVVFDGVLPALEGSFTTDSSSTAELTGQLSQLEGSFTIAVPGTVVLDGQLPALEGSFTISSKTLIVGRPIQPTAGGRTLQPTTQARPLQPLTELRLMQQQIG